MTEVEKVTKERSDFFFALAKAGYLLAEGKDMVDACLLAGVDSDMAKRWMRLYDIFFTGNETPFPEPEEESDLVTLGLSARASNALLRGGVKTVSTLRSMSYKDLSSIRTMGVHSMQEIYDRLVVKGVTPVWKSDFMIKHPDLALAYQEIDG